MAGFLVSFTMACSACALRESTPGRTMIIVGMILLPWSVVGASVYAIRRMMKTEVSPAQGEE